jgi:hypothetical protein
MLLGLSPAMRITLYILACMWISGCTAADDVAVSSDAASDVPDVRQVATGYRTFRTMTKESILVDPGLAMLCRGARQVEVEAARKVSGPHAHTAVNIFMNSVATDAFGKANATYPVGSIIVKEKKALGYWSATQPSEMAKANDGVGGMIKRPPGYDPTHGDWEYFYFEEANQIESGKIDACIQCHSGAAKDYVFGAWATSG